MLSRALKLFRTSVVFNTMSSGEGKYTAFSARSSSVRPTIGNRTFNPYMGRVEKGVGMELGCRASVYWHTRDIYDMHNHLSSNWRFVGSLYRVQLGKFRRAIKLKWLKREYRQVQFPTAPLRLWDNLFAEKGFWLMLPSVDFNAHIQLFNFPGFHAVT